MKKFSSKDAFREHMINGNIASPLEAMLLFGVQNPNAELTRMKKDGYIIGRQRVPMAKILARINQYTGAKAPSDLPTKEILMTEYWVKS